jgi:hypothetical protein
MRPTTSSIIAALVRTVPRRVRARPEEVRIEKVVPRLVAERAAPAAKHWSGVVPGTRVVSAKERAMGRRMPVAATAVESGRLWRSGVREVERPPVGVGG